MLASTWREQEVSGLSILRDHAVMSIKCSSQGFPCGLIKASFGLIRLTTNVFPTRASKCAHSTELLLPVFCSHNACEVLLKY